MILYLGEMGLLSIIKKTKRKEKEMRVLVLGLDNAGKTTCVRRCRNEDVTTTSPTLGFSISPLSFGDGYTLNIWDVGGQQSLRSYWRNYFETTDALIWVVDSSDVGRLRDCREELHALLQEERLAGASLLILLNKCDIPTSLKAPELSEKLDLQTICKGKRHVHMQQCSGVTGEGLLEGLRWLVQDIADRLYMAA